MISSGMQHLMDQAAVVPVALVVLAVVPKLADLAISLTCFSAVMAAGVVHVDRDQNAAVIYAMTWK